MLIDAIRWNTLNVIRVELFFDVYRLWNIIINSSIQSQRGQYAIVSLLITLVAHLSVQFNLTWLLSVYSVYLAIGATIWIHRRVYFYHRSRDNLSINNDLSNNQLKLVAPTLINNSKSNNGNHNTATLRHSSDKNTHSTSNNNQHQQQPTTTCSTSSNGLSNLIANNQNHVAGDCSEHTNSLQRQRALAYRDFQRTLSEPRFNPRVFALSLSHLSEIAKLVADEDAFDEMHFQILATRRDVVNIILRLFLICAATLLSYN